MGNVVDAQGMSAGFQTTMWSMVMQAQHNREVLETLLRSYWSPIYACVRRMGYSEHDASDLTQEFMLKVVLGRDLLSRATPQRGRFRTFVRTALSNFLIDQHRAGRARTATRAVELQDHHAGTDDRSPAGHDLSDVLAAEFDRRWASSLMSQAVERLHEHCLAEGMHDHWLAFDACVLGPTLRRQTAPTLDELARRLSAPSAPSAQSAPSAPSADTISNMVQTVKRSFRRILRETVAHTVEKASDVEDELAELRSLLAQSSGTR